MAEPIRIMGGDINETDNEGIQSQVDRQAGLHVVAGPINASNKKYENTLTAGVSPLDLDIETDMGRTGVSGYVINDGNSSAPTTGTFTVTIFRTGILSGEAFTLKPEEILELDHLKVSKIRLTHGGTDSDYRINVI